MNEDPHIGAAIRKLRRDREWSLRELSVRAGMSLNGLQLIETGQSDPSSTSIARIAKALNVGPGALYAPPKAQAPSPPPEAPVSAELAEEEERRSAAKVAKEIEEQNKRAIRRMAEVGEFTVFAQNLIELMEKVMKMNPDTATVEQLAEIADTQAVRGIDIYLDLNPDTRASGECEAAVKNLIDATIRMVEVQEAREKDKDKLDELRQRRQQVASRREA